MEVLIADIARKYDEDLMHFTPTAKQRRQFAAKGEAMPDGSFYIRNESDLDNAIKAVGRATPNASESETARRNSVRRHIMARARALKLEAKIPETWNGDGSLKQSAISLDLLDLEMEEFLSHYGVLGMHWGVRRWDNARRAGAPLRHPPSADAAKAAQLQAKVRAGGTRSLSNVEMQQLVTRMNLERQYSSLKPQHISQGRRFVTGAAKTVATALIVKYATQGAEHLIKKAAGG